MKLKVSLDANKEVAANAEGEAEAFLDPIIEEVTNAIVGQIEDIKLGNLNEDTPDLTEVGTKS